MNESIYRRMKDLPSTHLLGAGTAACSGCGGLQAIHEIYDVFGNKTVFVNAAGCMTLLTVYPFTPFSGSWLYTAMGSAPAGAQGVRDALDILLEKKRISEEDDLATIVLTGDGSAYGMGVSATSGAIDRQLDFLYICYDNEGYGNTGQQYSGATPHYAQTATSKAGYTGFKKDLFSLWVANKPAYVATVIGTEPLDLARKIEKAKHIKGPRLIIALAPCPTGWGFDPKESSEIGKLAVKTGIWPLKEFVDGKIIHSKIPKNRLPVEDYLNKQDRFSHLFKPEKKQQQVDNIQQQVDHYWDAVAND